MYRYCTSTRKAKTKQKIILSTLSYGHHLFLHYQVLLGSWEVIDTASGAFKSLWLEQDGDLFFIKKSANIFNFRTHSNPLLAKNPY